MTVDQIERASAGQALVFDAVMHAITAIHPMPEEGEGAGGIDFFPTLDGLLQTMATMTILSGAFTTTRDRRELADRIRASFVKHMADVERAVASGRYWEGRPLDAMP
ncbi:MAG: hypothetical protein ABI810_15170 [Sphingomonas bacterium]